MSLLFFSNFFSGIVCWYKTHLRSMLTDCHRTFLNKVFKFIGIGIALYAIVRLYIYGSDDESIIKHEKKCQYCRKKISLKV